MKKEMDVIDTIIYNDDTLISKDTNRPIDVEKYKKNLTEPTFWCETCQMSKYGGQLAVQHFTSDKHHRRVLHSSSETKNLQKPTINDNFVNMQKRKLPIKQENAVVNEAKKKKVEPSGEAKVEGEIKEATYKKSETSGGKDKKTEEKSKVKEITCEDCNIVMHCMENALQHFKGQRHIKKVAAKLKMKQEAAVAANHKKQSGRGKGRGENNSNRGSCSSGWGRGMGRGGGFGRGSVFGRGRGGGSGRGRGSGRGGKTGSNFGGSNFSPIGERNQLNQSLLINQSLMNIITTHGLAGNIQPQMLGMHQNRRIENLEDAVYDDFYKNTQSSDKSNRGRGKTTSRNDKSYSPNTTTSYSSSTAQRSDYSSDQTNAPSNYHDDQLLYTRSQQDEHNPNFNDYYGNFVSQSTSARGGYSSNSFNLTRYSEDEPAVTQANYYY